MKCPNCQAEIQKGQNFCGGCGYKLQRVCAACGTTSPLSFQFCGQCGKNLTAFGTIVLDRAGIIIEADKIALELLSKPMIQVKGRPFSFFIGIDDLVIFFSHWNELVDTSERQSIEIEIKTDKKEPIYVQIELTKPDPKNRDRFHMGISDITERRRAQNDLENKHDLINMVFSITEDLDKITDTNRKLAICDILEKICLFIGAKHSFLYIVNRPSRMLDIYCQWLHPDYDKKVNQTKDLSMETVRTILGKLQSEGTYIANNIEKCPTNERKELKSWSGLNSGAAILQTVYLQKRPYGIIVILNNETGSWSNDSIALIKLVSKLVVDSLQETSSTVPTRPRTRRKMPSPSIPVNIPIDDNDLDMMDSIEITNVLGKPQNMGTSKVKKSKKKAKPKTDGVKKSQMVFEPNAECRIDTCLKVFAGDNGNYNITCPSCRYQENVSPDLFAEKGFALNVRCQCKHKFPIMRERRNSYRKNVNLEGFYNLMSSGAPKVASAPAWGPMVVRDLSKGGLRFTSNKSKLLRPGDPLLLQFNLDNGPNTLIKKKALIKSVKDNTVSCQFEGSDRYDVSLGFYFM